MNEDERDRRRRHHGAHRSSGINDPHGRRSFVHRKPFGDDLRRGRKPTAFAGPEQEPASGEHPHAGGEAVRGTRQRPEQHDHQKAAPRAETIDERAAPGVRQRVGKQERRVQRAELGIGQWNVALDRGDGHRQRLPIEVADRDCPTHE